MTTTRDALMRAILVEPADDTVRLVLADHFEENGEPERAEFIRVQIELATRYPAHANSPEKACEKWHTESDPECPACSLRKRANMILHGLKLPSFEPPRWSAFAGSAARLVPHGELYDRFLTFSRGFVSAVRCRLADWVGDGEGQNWDDGFINATGRTPAHGPRIVAEHPVEGVEVVGKRPLVVNNPAEWSATTARWAMSRGGRELGFHLSKDIFELLPTGPACVLIRDAGESWNSMFSVRDYVDEAAAQSALSLALVNWARREAGLPPLEERT